MTDETRKAFSRVAKDFDDHSGEKLYLEINKDLRKCIGMTLRIWQVHDVIQNYCLEENDAVLANALLAAYAALTPFEQPKTLFAPHFFCVDEPERFEKYFL